MIYPGPSFEDPPVYHIVEKTPFLVKKPGWGAFTLKKSLLNFQNFWKKWFDRRINSQTFQWSFLADSFDLLDKSVKDKINCYSCIHLIKSISKTEIEPEIFEVEIETEAEI